MLAQRLRHSVTFEQRSTSINAYRENVGTWSTYATCFAGVEPVSGKEYPQASLLQAETLVRVIVRHEDAPALTPQMRMLFDGRYYDIVAIIDEMNRDRMWSVMCRVGVNAGA